MAYEYYINYPTFADYGNRTVFPPLQTTQSVEGWICPNCKRGVAPWKNYCDCAPTYEVPKTTG